MAGLWGRRQLARTPEDAPPTPILLDNGDVISISVRRSRRASRIALRLRSSDPFVELVLPYKVALSKGLAFLDERRPWAAARLSQLPRSIPFETGASVPVLGIARTIRSIGRGAGQTSPFRVTADSIDVTGDPQFIGRRVRRGLITLARDTLTHKSQVLAARMGKVSRISVGDARTRWGSCSSSGHLRYSWRLILAPESVVDYVVTHEVAHLSHMNHGPLFWKMVETLHPNYMEDRTWLRTSGPELLRYGN